MNKVILIKNFSFLGKIGDQVNVKYGYAINYLIPQKIAVFATKNNINKIKLEDSKIINEKNKKIENFLKLIKTIEELKEFDIYVKSYKNEKLFASIKSKQISELIYNITNIRIEDKFIIIKDKKIQKIGKYIILIKKYNKNINFILNVKNKN